MEPGIGPVQHADTCDKKFPLGTTQVFSQAAVGLVNDFTEDSHCSVISVKQIAADGLGVLSHSNSNEAVF